MGKRKKRRNKTKRESNHAITVEKPLINVQAQMETALVHEVEPKRSSILEGQDKKDIRHEQHPGNSNNRNLSAIFGGVIGALVVVIIIVFLSFIWPGFRLSKYYVNNDPSLLMGLLETSVTTSDSLAIANAINIETQNRQDLLADLLEQKVIVSSD